MPWTPRRWPGDARYPRAAFYAYAHPAPEGFSDASSVPDGIRWDATLGEFLLDWDDIRTLDDPHTAALAFAGTVFQHACLVCAWDPELASSAKGAPPPIR